MATTARGLAVLASVLGLLAGPAGPRASATPGAPADGRTVTSGSMTLTASQAADLVPGQPVTVSGHGYDEAKGIYVALCVIPPTGMAPSPCGGGEDRSGTSGASAWVSSNPPSYARGLTQPYGPGGSFSVTLDLSPTLPDGLDCYSVRCAIFTRADHTRSSDRSLDLGIPVTFAAPAVANAPAPPPPTSAPPVVAEPTTTAPSTTIAPTSTELPEAEPGTRVDEGAAGEPAAARATRAGGDGDRAPLVVAVAVLAVLLVGGATVSHLVLGRRRGPAAGGAP